MNKSPTLDRSAAAAKRGNCRLVAAFASMLVALIAVALPARAVDGCTVLLCLAAPKWQAVPACVPPIHQLFRDLAHGRSFPTCVTRGPGNSSANAWSRPPEFCPPQYTHWVDGERGPIYSCDYTGAVSISINGALFARTWWRGDGDAVTEFSPSARAQLGTWDTQFDNDYAAWLASHPSSPPIPQP